MTAPLVEVEPTATAAEIAHYVCCADDDYPYALCGADMRGERWARPEEPTCRDCEVLETRDCDAVCPRLTFGQVAS